MSVPWIPATPSGTRPATKWLPGAAPPVTIYTGPFHEWNAGALHLVTLEGEWNGTTVVPLAGVQGEWNGSTVVPLTS